MIYVINCVDDYGNVQGIFSVCTNRKTLYKTIKLYMKNLDIHLLGEYSLSTICKMPINDMNEYLRDVDDNEDEWKLCVETYVNGEYDTSFLR